MLSVMLDDCQRDNFF